MITKKTLANMIVVACAALGGCGDEEAPATPETIASKEIALETNTETSVAGRFTRDGATVVFLLERHDGDHFARFSTAAGEVLAESKLHDGIDNMKLFGGTLKIVGGEESTEPMIEGDKNELERFARLPEAKLLRSLGDALAAAGVDRDFYAPAASKLTTQSIAGPYVLYCGQRMTIPAWSIWWPIRRSHYNTSFTYWAHYRITDFWSYDESLPPGGYASVYGPYWNYFIVVENLCTWGRAPVWTKGEY